MAAEDIPSCGIQAVRKQTKIIRKQLIRIKLLEENDAWEALSLKVQTEQECGIRMMIYMLKLMERAQAKEPPHQVLRQIHRTISNEQAETGDLEQVHTENTYTGS